jgi:hypothetical protein
VTSLQPLAFNVCALPSLQLLGGSDQTQQSTSREMLRAQNRATLSRCNIGYSLVAAALLFALSALFALRSPLHDRKAEAQRAACVDRPAVGVVPAEYTCDTP